MVVCRGIDVPVESFKICFYAAGVFGGQGQGTAAKRKAYRVLPDAGARQSPGCCHLLLIEVEPALANSASASTIFTGKTACADCKNGRS